MKGYLASRIKQAEKLLEEHSIDAVIATSTSNFFYFTDTWIEAHEQLLAIVIRKTGQPFVIAPKMHEEDLADSGLETLFWNDGEDALSLLVKSLPETGTISVDNVWPSQNLVSLMRHRPQLSFVESTKTLGRLRLKKDPHELNLLREAGAAADRVMEQIIGKVKPGMLEMELAEELRHLWTKEGVYDLSFAPIIGAGPHGALPHHQTSQTAIKPRDVVVIDMGGIGNHYCSDVTRTIVVGEASPKAREVYEVVRRAQEVGAQAVKPGVPIGHIDRVTRGEIDKAGYGNYFIHRTGHGLGIDVHEEPFVHGGNQQLIEPGMVFSIEPGIYLPGEFGVRIEDIVIATETGCESLNRFRKDLLVV